MRIKAFLPNLITLLNLLSGCIAVIYAMQDELLLAGLFVMLGIFFDFFDGLVARLLKVSSDLGTQLDSLADMVTSGLVPGLVMYQMIATTTGGALFENDLVNWLACFGFVITLGSCYRLAKFNIDTRQTDSFIGVPTPANAIFIISLGIIQQTTDVEWLFYLLHNLYFLLGLTILSCILLNAELPLFALKFKNFGWKGNELRYCFLILSIIMIVVLQIYAIPCIIFLYVLLSIINNSINKGG
ncbi:MAG: CDP-alcohol phosphatidyltransferase family protein [Nonlabens sp.]